MFAAFWVVVPTERQDIYVFEYKSAPCRQCPTTSRNHHHYCYCCCYHLSRRVSSTMTVNYVRYDRHLQSYMEWYSFNIPAWLAAAASSSFFALIIAINISSIRCFSDTRSSWNNCSSDLRTDFDVNVDRSLTSIMPTFIFLHFDLLCHTHL